MINGNVYGNGIKTANGNVNGNGNGVIYGNEERENGVLPVSPSSSCSPKRYIEHHVSKMDTLAGIAIRYGVEVADVKKMNGLVTDLQMYALKTLQIPLPGRHPPSPCLSNDEKSAGSNKSPSLRMNSDLLEPFQSLRITPDRKLSPAMCSLRDYYGLNGRNGRNSTGGCEMTVYNKGSTNSQQNEAFPSSSPLMNPPLSQHRRSRSVANGFNTEEDEMASNINTDYRKWIGKLSIRPQKPEETRTPEKLLKEENGSSSWFSAITGKGLALRAKASSRTNLMSDGETSGINGFPSNISEPFITESSSGVRKSLSTPSLQDRDGDGSSSSSIWNTSKWSLKPDLQAALANPLFDGFSKPITGRKPKAALD